MRSYDVAVTALVVDATSKWTDNLLTHHTIPDVVTARRGVARRISHSALVRIALIRQLHVRLGLGVADAVSLAARLLDSEALGVHECGQLSIAVDLPALELAVGERLASVLESAPAPRRGRPPRRHRA